MSVAGGLAIRCARTVPDGEGGPRAAYKFKTGEGVSGTEGDDLRRFACLKAQVKADQQGVGAAAQVRSTAAPANWALYSAA